jgi:tRNA pseudouridine38-40 synthase
MRYFIECSYQGTKYCGWQIQENANTVQAEIEKALSTLLKIPVTIMGSSRTDTGVHAVQQVAHFDIENDIQNLENLAYRLNKILPFDISIKRIYPVKDDYHCRFEATSRKYEYRISFLKNPFLRGLYYEFNQDLNIELMNESCQKLFQYHDFECFSKIKTDVKTFNCTIMEATWEKRENDMLVFHIKANRFLRGMVRAIVGTLLEIGAGKLSVEDFEQIILSKNRKKAGRAVPAEGLFLMEVNYDIE